MDRISYNSLKIINFFENLNPKTSGVIFSTLIHLIILLFMVGLPNFFSTKEIYVPNVIPIEILNVDENTNLAVVAPGIAEALFATALGLFVAIPAVLAYNKISNDLSKYFISLETFMDEFSTIFFRQLEKK